MTVARAVGGSMPLTEVVRGLLARGPSTPESSVTIGVTAKRLHTWEVTVRGDDPSACTELAQRLDDELTAKFSPEVERSNGNAAADDRSAD